VRQRTTFQLLFCVPTGLGVGAVFTPDAMAEKRAFPILDSVPKN
jgi:hypothetical protein